MSVLFRRTEQQGDLWRGCRRAKWRLGAAWGGGWAVGYYWPMGLEGGGQLKGLTGNRL